MTDSDGTFDLPEFLGIVGRRWRVVLLCTLLIGGAAIALSLAQTPRYTASTSLLFRDPGFDRSIFGGEFFEQPDATREAATNAQLVALDSVAARTASILDNDLSAAEVESKVDSEAVGESDLVRIDATDSDPDFAAELANAFGSTFIEIRKEADQAKIEESRDLITAELESLGDPELQTEEAQALQRQVSDLKTLEALQTGNAELVEEAEPPSDPSSPQTLRNAILGILVGLLLGVCVAMLRDRLDRRLRHPSELEAALGLPVIVAVPESDDLSNVQASDGIAGLSNSDRQVFRMLHTRLRYFNVDRNINSLLITSASAGEGKTTIAWNLALISAEAGAKVLLIEVDFQRPTVAERTGLSPLPGLSEFLTNQSSFEGSIQSIAFDPDSTKKDGELDVLVAGATPPAPIALLESARSQKLLQQAVETYDLVVIDTPPIATVADAIPLITRVDGVLIVGRLGATTREEAEHLGHQLSDLGAPTLGVVANRARQHRGYYGYDTGLSRPAATRSTAASTKA